MPAAPEKLDPNRVLLESGTDDPLDFVRLGIAAAREGYFERGLAFLAEAYRRLSKDRENKLPAIALSYYGLCLALSKGRVKEAAEYCQLAIEKEFYNGENYLNMAKVWSVGRARRKAVDAIQRGLAVDPGNRALLEFRSGFGFRKSPVIPFLHRDNALNVSLGRLRHKLKKPAAEATGSARRTG